MGPGVELVVPTSSKPFLPTMSIILFYYFIIFLLKDPLVGFPSVARVGRAVPMHGIFVSLDDLSAWSL